MLENMRALATDYLRTVIKRCMTPSAYKDAILRLKITKLKEFKHGSLLQGLPLVTKMVSTPTLIKHLANIIDIYNKQNTKTAFDSPEFYQQSILSYVHYQMLCYQEEMRQTLVDDIFAT